ncbi:MAG TPA: hypothetical protein VGI81_12905 [Tepidisphaeraceae bacterium]|jgi:hypothetical protein
MASGENQIDNKQSPAPATATAEAPPRHRHRFRRWLARIAAVVLGLLLLIAIVIQIVLWTGLPKQIVVGQVENGLGLRMAVGSLSTGWLGHTSLGDVKIALPISDQSFFDVPEMKVKHTNLIALILGWPVEVNAVELKRPVLYVRQSRSGQWNLQQVIELLARAGGKKTGEQTASTSAPALPYLKIEGMTIVVLDNKGHQVKVEPINVDGSPDTPAWKYDVEIPSQQANVPPHLSVLGRVAPGGTWAQEATVWVNDVSPWVRPFAPTFDQKVTTHVKWTGQIREPGIAGFLEITDAAFGAYHADGGLSVTQNASAFSLGPKNLHLSQKDLTQPVDKQSTLNVTIPSGTLDYDGKTIRATHVQLAMLGGPATFNGWFAPGLRQGALEAFWMNMQVPQAGVTQSGKLNVSFSRPAAAPINISILASSSGTAPQGTFDAVVKADVTGPNFTNLTWEISIPQLAYYRAPQPVILNGLSAAGGYTQDAQHKLVRLDRISLPADNRLAGNGTYDLTTMQGHLHVEGQDWPLHLIQGSKIAFLIDASGQGQPKTPDPGQSPSAKPQLVPVVQLNALNMRTGDAALTVTGVYDGRNPKPVDMNIRFVNKPGPAAQTGQPELIHGYLAGQWELSGILGDSETPMAIDLTGTLTGHEAEVLGHPLGDVSTKLVGSIDDQKATIRADGIPLLDGIWNLGATYVLREAGKPVYATTVDLSVDHLPLPRVTQFLGEPKVDGVFAGRWYVYFPGLKPNPSDIRVTGGGSVRGLAVSSLTADEMTFTTSLDQGTFSIDPVRLKHGNYGRVDASARINLNNWRQVNAALQLTNFPIDLSSMGAGLLVSGGSSRITVLLPNARAKDEATHKLRVESDLDLRTVISIESQADAQGQRTMQPEGTVRTLIGFQGRTVDLRALQGELLGGTLTGNGVADFDHLLTQTRLNVDWDGLQSDRIVRLYPGLKGFGGTYSGTARLAPATVARPLEPLSLDIENRASNGHWRAVKIGNAQVHAFLGWRQQRFADATATTLHLIGDNERTSGIDIGGGRLDFWVSSSGHIDLTAQPNGVMEPSGVTISNQLNLTLRSLEVDQFVKALVPDYPKSGYGQLSGKVFLLSAPKRKTLAAIAASTSQPTTGPGASTAEASALQHLLATTTMDTNVTIENSDLGNFGPIAFLYNAMHLGGGPRTPTGHGTVSATMEDGRLHVARLYYFNRGIEVRGVATVDQMWNLPDSPLQGTVIGTARPLKNIRLPLFAETDAILAALQNSLTTVGFGGTLRNPSGFYLVSLRELAGDLRGLVLREAGSGG